MMNKEQKYLLCGHLFCEDCRTDDEISCPRDRNVICLNMKCRKHLCGYHMIKHKHTIFKCLQCNEILGVEDMAKHLEDEHKISCEWRGV